MIDLSQQFQSEPLGGPVAGHPRTALPPTASGRRPVTVVVPCYNEEETLAHLRNRLAEFAGEHEASFDLAYIFVDDGSTDRTLEILYALFGARPDCRVLSHATNIGIAAASMTGVSHATTETVCVIDCDCTYDPGELARMVPMLTDGVAMVTASPYHREGAVLNVPNWRLFLSRTLSLLYRQVLRHKLATYTACFRVYRRSSVATLKIDNNGFLGIAEILARLDMNGAAIRECPAVLGTRLFGTSKMKILSTIKSHLGFLLILGLHRTGFWRPALVGSRHE